MREADEREVAAFGHHPQQAVLHGYNESAKCYTLLTPEAEPAAIAGVVSCDIYKGLGRVWLLGTDAIERYPMTFLRNSRELLDELGAGYDGLYNYAHAENAVHLKWLKWLGFTLLRRVEHNGEPFIEFVKLKG